MKIVCFTNENDTKDLIRFNKFGFELKFIKTNEELSDADFYIVSLKWGTKYYNQFIKFMREHPKSKFLFLNEYTETLDDKDFEIRDEENTDNFMYVPSAALKHIMELITQRHLSFEGVNFMKGKKENETDHCMGK